MHQIELNGNPIIFSRIRAIDSRCSKKMAMKRRK